MTRDIAAVDVLAPNFKKRLSGVTSTVIRLVPLQAEQIAIAATGPVLPDHVPQVPLSALVTMNRRPRVWHARRNVEMIGGLGLKHLLQRDLRLLFTSASQRHHTGLTKWLIARMDRVVATSTKTAQYLERDATVIHHGIDTDQFSPAPDKAGLRAKLGLPEGRLVGCYGRIRAQKGTDVFVDAMISTLHHHADVSAIVMGRATEKHGGFLDGLKAKVAEAGLTGRILFKPEVEVWQMADWYRVLDLYIAPQRWEGFGLTPLEAMSCGVPCIATRVGAFEELIARSETGLLILPGDIEAMTDAVARLLGQPETLGEWSQNARAHVLVHFRIEREAAALIAIYREMLAR